MASFLIFFAKVDIGLEAATIAIEFSSHCYRICKKVHLDSLADCHED